MDPAGLWEAGLAEAEAAGIPDVLRREVGLASHPASEDVHRAVAECAAAMGLLLCRLPHLTALSLSMPCVPAALKLLLQGGAKGRLQAVKLHDSASYCQPRDGGGMDWLAAGPNSHDNRISEASLSLSHKFTLPALLACTSLTSLELSTKLAYRVLATLVQSANMRALRSLRLPTQIVCQGLLDIMLKDLPGEASVTGCWSVLACLHESLAGALGFQEGAFHARLMAPSGLHFRTLHLPSRAAAAFSNGALGSAHERCNYAGHLVLTLSSCVLPHRAGAPCGGLLQGPQQMQGRCPLPLAQPAAL